MKERFDGVILKARVTTAATTVIATCQSSKPAGGTSRRVT